MKKLLSFLLIVLFLFSFSACKESPKAQNNAQTENISAENSVEKIYDNFLSGKITAVYNGSNIGIDYLSETAKPHTLSYALFDRNGDSVPELCINNNVYVTTFWVSDGELKLWKEENANSKILSNGNCLQTHYGGAPNHSDYRYCVYSYTGEDVCSVTVSVLIKNGIDVPEDIYTQNIYIYSGSPGVSQETEITKEQFDATLDAIEKIGEAEITWKLIK